MDIRLASRVLIRRLVLHEYKELCRSTFWLLIIKDWVIRVITYPYAPCWRGKGFDSTDGQIDLEATRLNTRLDDDSSAQIRRRTE